MATEVIKTVGAGGDYATLDAAMAALPASLVAADEQWTLKILDETVSVGAFYTPRTTDATRYLKITADPEHRWNVKSKPIRSAGGAGIRLGGAQSGWFSPYTRLENLKLRRSGSPNFVLPPRDSISNTPNDCTVRNCCLVAESGAGTNTAFFQKENDWAAPSVANCYIINEAYNGSFVLWLKTTESSPTPIPTGVFANNTFIRPPYTASGGSPDSAVYIENASFSDVAPFNTNNVLIAHTDPFNQSWVGAASISSEGSTGTTDFNVNSTSYPSPPPAEYYGATGVVGNLRGENLFMAWTADPATCDFRLKDDAAVAALAGTTRAAAYTGGVDIYGDARTGTSTRGAMQNKAATGLALVGQPIQLTATLDVVGDVQIAALFLVEQDGSIELVGTLALTGDIYAGLPKLVLEQVEALLLTGSLSISGDIKAITRISDGLPEGWYLVKVLEEVPNPNFGTPYGQNYFVRWTYLGYDDNDIMLAASGALEDAFNQLLSIAQSRSQQRPYDGH